MRRALDLFYGGLMALSAVAMAACFVCVMLGIADRQFAFGLRGLDAYAGYAIAAALFLALPGTLQKGEHIRVTLLLQRVPAGEGIRAAGGRSDSTAGVIALIASLGAQATLTALRASLPRRPPANPATSLRPCGFSFCWFALAVLPVSRG